MKHNIVLTMMVKNENRPCQDSEAFPDKTVIQRCLESVRPYISHWVVCDTGSTDGTQDAVRQHLAGIPGELHEVPWVGYGTNRTQVHDLARDYIERNGVENAYHLVIDADEAITVWNKGIPYDKAPAFWGTIEDYRSKHRTPRAALLNNDLEWWWQFEVHHRLTTRCGTWPPETPDEKHGDKAVHLVITHYADGASWADPWLKYREKVAIAMAELAADFTDAGRWFSLGKCCQILEQAPEQLEADFFKKLGIMAYENVIHYSESEQEIYHSIFCLARMKDDPVMMMEAYNYRPQRPDAPYELGSAYEQLGLLHLADAWYFVASDAIKKHPLCGDIVYHDLSIRDKIKDDRKRIKDKIREQRNQSLRAAEDGK